MLIVGIAGGSASGKTTFAQALGAALISRNSGRTVETISTDRYFRSRRDPSAGPRFVSPSTGEERFNANHPDAVDANRLIFDLDEMASAPGAPDIVVIEGHMALAIDALRERMDVRLFIEMDADERALRRLLRDMGGARGTTDPHAIATYYRECARIGHALYVEPSRVHADLILRGDADFDRVAMMTAAVIEDRLSAINNDRKA